MIGALCCCCNDVYFGNDDGVVAQFHLSPPSIVPKVQHLLPPPGDTTNYYLGAVDYRRKRVIVTRVVGSVFMLYYTPTEQLKNPIAIGVSNTVGFAGDSVAVDWGGERVFYAGDRDIGPTKYSFRVVNLDGTNDVEIATETYSAGNPVFYLRTLQYDPLSDKLYYTRRRVTNILTGDTDIELRSMNGDGTNQRTEVILASLAGGDFALRGNFVVPSLGLSVAAVTFNATHTTQLLLVDIASGASLPIKTTVLADGSFPVSNPQYCYKDGKIYFLSFLNALGGPGDNRASMHRIDADGSNEEVVFSFADPTNTNQFLWSGWTQADLLRLSCGFETMGGAYSGVG